MTNLFDFLSEWHTGVKIYVESKDGKIYSGLISDIDEEKASRYWVVEGTVKLQDEGTYIFVEHEDEVNKKLEEQNEVSFSAIWKCINEDSYISNECYHSFDALVKSANDYVYYRKNWNQFPVKMLGKYNRERSLAHDLFILALDDLASIVGKQNNRVPWRVVLGNDRHMLGEFAEYIVDRIRLSKERIELIETMIWAQDHRNQIIHCVGESVSSQDAKIRIMKQFKFNESQALGDYLSHKSNGKEFCTDLVLKYARKYAEVCREKSLSEKMMEEAQKPEDIML